MSYSAVQSSIAKSAASALRACLLVLFVFLAVGCGNNPYRPGQAEEETFFTSLSTPPSKLDPATAYYSHEGLILAQIYEPALTYHYLKRPYEVVPLTAEEVPAPVYFDHEGNIIEDEDPPAEMVARAEYTVRIKPGIMYADHPCFARDEDGELIYHDVTPEMIRNYNYPSEFTHQGTRELVAEDYVRQIRRLADPRIASPIYSTIARYIKGFEDLFNDYNDLIEAERARRREAAGAAYNQVVDERDNPIQIDYMEVDTPGVKVVDRYTYKVVLDRKYPQILYWMCMHFFCPMPQEALDFYSQRPMIDKQFSINRAPVGTGPYYLDVYRPSEVLIFEKNQNYHDMRYPSEGEPGDEQAGLLADAGKRVPFIERMLINIEREAISHWNKFLQGYYDTSGIAADVFDQAIQIEAGQDATLTPEMEERGIYLETSVQPTLFYLMFNMKDDVVGGLEPEQRKLRQAISIALDYEEYLTIFLNGRGVKASGPIPPGIFGHLDGEEGVNPYIDQWCMDTERSVRKPIEEARQLMREAGYPDGRGPDGTPLTLYFDHSQSGQPAFRSILDWMRNSLEQLGIRLRERETDLSRYRQKLDSGEWQISSLGWLADYPDPENFLFLFYGPNGKADFDGPNSSNYSNPEYDRIFEKLESMENTPERFELIRKAVDILQRDAVMTWQFHPEAYTLCHEWYQNFKPHDMAYNLIKYRRVDPALRVKRQHEWNQPIYWPLVLLGVIIVGGIVPAGIKKYKRERGL